MLKDLLTGFTLGFGFCVGAWVWDLITDVYYRWKDPYERKI